MKNERVALFDSNGKTIIGIGQIAIYNSQNLPDWKEMDAFIQTHHGSTIFVSISYELKKAIYPLDTKSAPNQWFPMVVLWVSESVYQFENETLMLKEGAVSDENKNKALEVIKNTGKPIDTFQWEAVQTKEAYCKTVNELKREIQLGNVYEVNYCQEFFANTSQFDGLTLFSKVNETAQAPYSVLWENDLSVVVSASPERFLQLKGTKLISQPIKGTAKRGVTVEADELLKEELKNSWKNKTENVMIVDLVRNDLSRIAVKGSVKVDELFGIYTFPTVHQMISTVSCEVKSQTKFTEIIQALFPMGSMTGAPKVAAIQLAEKHELFTRGLYSGSIGYIAPNGDFDLNVMIRSFIYQRSNQRLSCAVGGAITHASDAEEEYEECLIKVGKLLHLVGEWK